MKQTAKGTWIDMEGRFADPGTEFVFDPRNSGTANQESTSREAPEETFLMKDGEVV